MNWGNRNVSKVRHFRVHKRQIFMQLTKKVPIVSGKINQKVLPQKAPSVCVNCKMLGSQLMVANYLTLERRGK